MSSGGGSYSSGGVSMGIPVYPATSSSYGVLSHSHHHSLPEAHFATTPQSE